MEFLELFFRLFYTLLGNVYLRAILRAFLHGGGGSQVGEVTRLTVVEK